MHNLDKEVAASGFTKEMEEEFDEVCILPEGSYNICQVLEHFLCCRRTTKSPPQYNSVV